MRNSKPAFDGNAGFVRSNPMDPEWKAGKGLNSHPGAKEYLKYHVIEVGKTQVEARSLYKVMLGNIVSWSEGYLDAITNVCTVSSASRSGRHVQC
jgi:hypothetical protein